MRRSKDPCRVPRAEAKRRIRALATWSLEGKVLVSRCELPSRPAAVAFAAFVVELGAALGGEPIVLLHGGQVTVRLASERGLREESFLLAEAIEGV